jgi:molecular chaperone DnaK
MVAQALPSTAPLGRMQPTQLQVPSGRNDGLVERNAFQVPTELDTDVIDPRVDHRPRAPVLIDVTPRALAVGTVGGWCDELIPRNSPIPIEQSRVFSTAHDGQTSVEVKVCQGESRRFDENILLGTVVLEGLPAMPRGHLKIHVTFEINTDGILEARARDDKTGQVRSVSVHLLGAQSEEEVAAARDRLRQLR